MTKRLRSRRPLGLALACAAALATSCGESDTVLTVLVESAAPISGVVQFRVSVDVGGRKKDLLVPDAPQTLVLSQNFNVILPADVSGAVVVKIDAISETMMVIARGEAGLPALRSGAVNDIVVTLVSVVPGMMMMDGGMMMMMDGGVPPKDGGTTNDGGVPDAAPDTVTPMPDTMVPMPDTMAPVPDTMTPEPDVAAPEPDVAAPEPDAAPPDADLDTMTLRDLPGDARVLAIAEQDVTPCRRLS